MRINDIAAAIHADMVNDERNGYSWEERWGQSGNAKTLWFDGKPYTYNLGDRDCSSSCIEAWQLAIQYTPWAGALDGAWSTHSMRAVFSASGLFDVWDTYSTSAETGDLYLNDQNHVAMCQDGGQTGGWDCLSEFSWGDNGAYGNVRGDQSGWESHITGFYDYPWDCTLHYNGVADGTIDGGGEPYVPVDPPAEFDPNQVLYRVWTGGEWLDEMRGLADTGWSGDDYGGMLGCAMGYIAIEGVGKYRVCSRDSGWLPWVDRYDPSDFEYGCAGDGSPILALEIPNAGVRYQLHDLGGDWNAWMVGSTDTGGSSDTFAGSMQPADAVRIEWA